MKLRDMEIFQAIMRTGSITEAARHLNVSQPAVSKMLKRVEDVLGFRLFKREGGRLQATAEAKELYPSIDRIFANIDTVQKIAQDLRDMKTGLIRIATIPTLGMTYLPTVISSFVRDRPGVHIGIKILNAEQTLDRVINRQVDIGIVYAPAEDVGATAEEICSAEVICVMPRTHRLASEAFIEPAMLADEPLISVNRASAIGALIDDAFRRNGLRRHSIVEVSHSFIAHGLVEAGAGIAVVDPFVDAEKYFPSVAIKQFRPRIEINPRVLYPSSHPLSQLNRAFIDHLRQHVKDMQSASPA